MLILRNLRSYLTSILHREQSPMLIVSERIPTWGIGLVNQQHESQTELSRYPRCINRHRVFLVQQHRSGIMSQFGEATDRANPLLSCDEKAYPSASDSAGSEDTRFRSSCEYKKHMFSYLVYCILIFYYFRSDIPSLTQLAVLLPTTPLWASR